MSKLFWIILIFGVAIRETKGAVTIRDMINGPDPESKKFERIMEVMRALLKRFFLMYQASAMANSYYNNFDDNPVLFNADSVEDFTFSPSKSPTVSNQELEVNAEQSEASPSSTSSTTTTTNAPNVQNTDPSDNHFDFVEETTAIINQ
jgi:hypothetical protein